MSTLEDAVSGLRLWPHHLATLHRAVDRLAADPTVLAVLLGGSLAHGFAGERADVDVVVVVTADELARRARTLELTDASHELATYEGGYVDAKFVDLGFLREVADRGSDPARWAYARARVLFSREPALRGVLEDIPRYPQHEHEDRVRSFAAQLVAWRWFYREGSAKDNAYLQVTAVHKLVLFANRLTLAHNRVLYPFHKWVLRVVAEVPNRPAELPDLVDALLTAHSPERVDALVTAVLGHFGHDEAEVERTWGTQFLLDTELAWQHGRAPIDEI